MPTSEGDITITVPAGDTEAMVGAALRVAGNTTPRERSKPGSSEDETIPPKSVWVGFAGGSLQPARALGADWSGWEASLQPPGPGSYTVLAVASWSTQLTDKKEQVTDRVTVTFIATPLDLVAPAAPVGTVEFPVTVAAGGQGVAADSVRARIDGQVWALAPAGPLRWTGLVRLNSEKVPAGGRVVPMELLARSNNDVPYQRTVEITAVDAVVPVVIDFTPADGAKLTGTAVGASIPVEITVSDSGQGQLSSGIAAIDVRVDETSVAAQQKPDKPGVWTARIFVPGADEHTVTVQARDGSGHRSVPVSHHVVVTRRTDLRDLSLQTYLQELLTFTSDRITTREPAGAETPPFVTSGHLLEVLGQDVAAVARGGTAEVAAPVRTLRLVVEALANYLRPLPAPVAAWPLHEGTGDTVADAASGRAVGTVTGAQWLAEDPSVLHFDPAARAHVQVHEAGSAQAGVHQQLTLVARVRPTADTQGVVVGKEGEYLLARFPDGTIRWALSYAAPGWGWVDTGAVVAQDRWSHLMLAYDGAHVRTWIDGVLRHSVEAKGAIGDFDRAANEVTIGARNPHREHFAGDIAEVAVFDRALAEADLYRMIGRSGDANGTRWWVDDDLPPGATTAVDNDAWTWTDRSGPGPSPPAGTRCHLSAAASGRHQHLFTITEDGFAVDRGDALVTDVWLDPQNAPRQVMLQWRDSTGSWEHRAYWGEDLISWGIEGTDSLRRMGELPAVGGWVTLRVPARLVGLENEVVHGVGYVLFDGQAAWDRTGRDTPRAVAARSGHLAAAYAALLRAHGTSEVELRLARGATPAQRAALARRLGIRAAPEAGADDIDADDALAELDQLLLDPAQLTAAALTQLFGYADPLSAAPAAALPELTRWRLAMLRRLWRTADRTSGQPPVIDPEVLVADDLVDPDGVAAHLLGERQGWRRDQVRALAALRTAAGTDDDAVNAALGVVLPDVDLYALNAARRAGQDISGALTAAGLEQRELLRLVQVRALAATGGLRDEEWDDLVRALVRVLRRRNWQEWRAKEATADMVLDPAVFHHAATDVGALPDYLDTAARQEWLDRLDTRALVVNAVAAGQRAAVDRADDAALPIVRDALLDCLDPQIPGVSVADALSTALFIDVGAGPEDVSSPIGQATEAMQGLMLAIRNNRLGPLGPWPPAGPARDWVLRQTEKYPRAEFDEEYQWVGRWDAWRAAVSAFFRPELLLYPRLRAISGPNPPPGYTPTLAFRTFLAAVDEAGGGLTPELARGIAARYRERLSQDTKEALARVGHRLADLVLTDQLSPDQTSALAEGQRTLLHEADTLTEIPRELQEALWLAQLHLAVTFSRLGQNQSAIDWIRTLYAYDRTGDDRLVFAGFRLEQGPAKPLERTTRWLTSDTLNPHRIADGRAGTQLRFTLLLLASCLVEQGEGEFTADTQESRPLARTLFLTADRALRAPEFDDATGPDVPRIPANPLLAALRGRCAANLGKLRRGLTIAGVPRPVAAAYENTDEQLTLPSLTGGAPAPPVRPPQPTPYRYAPLMARAQHLVALAGQVESAYHEAMINADREGFTEQQANNGLDLAKARRTVLQTAVEVADDELEVSRRQALRARNEAETLEGWSAAGESDFEQQLLASYQQIADLQSAVAFTDAAMSVVQATAAASGFNPAAPGITMAAITASMGKYMATGLLASAEATSKQTAARASFERRAQELKLQAAVARDEESIALQQGIVLKHKRTLVEQERDVGDLEQAHAQASVTYLAQRRFTAEMHGWVAGQNGDVYRFLLRLATSVGQKAQQQLAADWQLPDPGIIKADYWPAPGTIGSQQPAPDRLGLTGSARLLRDLTQLDEHAFELNRRKLNLQHTFALSATAPEAFADFRRTGVLSFATPMEAFDRRFPGDFLRTTRRVGLTVVALIPPSQGIAATLTCSGQSRLVVGQHGVFRPITLTRPPETVAYTSPVNATGVFELDPQPELKYFFEDQPVDTTWQLRLPRPANPIDPRSIAEVLVTIEYTALHDADYARQVRAALPQRQRTTLGLSIRDTFPDAWYTLVEGDPAQPGRVVPVSLPVTSADFPPNMDSIRAEALTLLVIRAGERDEDTPEIAVDHLHLVRGERRIRGGAATAVRDIISTRLGATTWLPLTDPPARVAAPGKDPHPWDPAPTGVWELALSNELETRDALRSGAITDLVLVLSYRGDLPPWPPM
ncbi:LamG-like jellyroll fold domain-containing protein [Streptomyces sp. NPDC059517]|uniref:Tc toxin subunit A-related protein n=1 Tax=Streptomyces sp. NPDC059517 TaxID=3346855 RepID=UPI00369F305F